jgi:hypothetical protein
MAEAAPFTPRPLVEGIWVAEGPHLPDGRIPIPVRMTVVRLSDGGLWLHSPIDAMPGLVASVRALGEVRHLVAPNAVHLSWLPDWQKAFPEAKAWGAPGAPARARRKGLAVHWEPDLTDEAPPNWRGDLEQMVVRGSPVHKETVFLHRASRTLILTDLIENLEPRRLPVWLGVLARVGGVADPDGKAPPHLRAAFLDRRALRASVERLIGWAPERVVIAHGRIYEANGTAELRRAFRWVL